MVMFSAGQAAAALWTYGEDQLVERALAITDAELRGLWVRAGAHWRVDHGLPLKTRLVVDKVIAFTCIEHLEGRLRPLAQERRRPSKSMPGHLRDTPGLPPGTLPSA
jgi:hypothetical protein